MGDQQLNNYDKILLMRTIEQNIVKIIQTIPNQPQTLIASDRFIVLSLLKNALRENPPEKPDFEITGFRNDLRTPIPTLNLNLRRAYPLNDFLLHFLDVTVAIGITNPILCREYADVIDMVTQYERALVGDPLEEGSKKYQRRERKGNRLYSNQSDVRIVEYMNPEEAYNQITYGGHCPKRFIDIERDRRTITFQPKEEKIGPLPPTLILEAYLLYLLHVQKLPEKV